MLIDRYIGLKYRYIVISFIFTFTFMRASYKAIPQIYQSTLVLLISTNFFPLVRLPSWNQTKKSTLINWCVKTGSKWKIKKIAYCIHKPSTIMTDYSLIYIQAPGSSLYCYLWQRSKYMNKTFHNSHKIYFYGVDNNYRVYRTKKINQHINFMMNNILYQSFYWNTMWFYRLYKLSYFWHLFLYKLLLVQEKMYRL